MKATLEFQLREDEVAYVIAVHAMDFALTCWKFDQQLCKWLRHGHEFKDIDSALQGARDMFHELLAERNISLDMIQ